MKMVVKGLHIVAELYGCPAEKISTVSSVKEILNLAVKEANLKKLSESYQQFKPHGATGFILLETSHISIHTWPEFKYAAVDVFTCGNPEQGKKAIEACSRLFNAETTHKKEIIRGESLTTMTK